MPTSKPRPPVTISRPTAGRPSRRKATGAFYTPQWVVEYIVEQALEPLLAERSASLARERPRPSPDSVRQRFLDVRVLDPAMGSGHFLVEALDYIATWIATDPSYQPADDDEEADLVELRRLVAEHCIYGVDVSYLAVELAKLSMWLRTMVFGKPLDFLDHHLRWGNSVVGVADLRELAQIKGGLPGGWRAACLSDGSRGVTHPARGSVP